jgi:hypothetical protein
VLALIRRERWPILFSVLIITFIAIMSIPNRGKPEYYLLPIMPALWLLAGRAIVVLSKGRLWLTAAGLVLVTAVPLVEIVRQNVEWTRPDTRVVAKQWIEANIPAGSKILMDGFQYRFVPSPPLTPDRASIVRQIEGVAKEAHRYRGISEQTLKLYAEAMSGSNGPAYDLHSTKWGLMFDDPEYVRRECFDYLVTSSYVSNRYADGRPEDRFPQVGRFYDTLDANPDFRRLYAAGAVPWQRTGPTIAVYKVLPGCQSSQTPKLNAAVPMKHDRSDAQQQ